MKLYLSILISILFSVPIFSQVFESNLFFLTPCDEGYVEGENVLFVSDEELQEIYKNLKRELNPFEEFDFKNENFEIVYKRQVKDSIFTYHIFNKEELLKLQKSYLLNEIVPEVSGTCVLETTKLVIILDNQPVEFLSIDEKCRTIETKCGAFKFSPEMLYSLGEKCTSFYENNKFQSKKDLDIHLKDIQKSEHLLFYYLHEKYKGHFQFIYEDSNDEVQKILADSFFSDIIIKNIYKKTPEDFLTEQDKLELVIRYFIEKDFDIELFEFRDAQDVSTETSRYLITMSCTSREDFEKAQEIVTLIKHWADVSYSVSSYWKK